MKVKRIFAALLASAVVCSSVFVMTACSFDKFEDLDSNLSASAQSNIESTESNSSEKTNTVVSSISQSDSAYVKEKGTLLIGVTDFAPMDYMDANGNWTGIDAAFAEAFAEYLGVKAEFVEIDWDLMTETLNNKKIDCVWNGLIFTDSREDEMELTSPYFNDGLTVVVKKDKANSMKSVDDIKNLKVAVEKDSDAEFYAMDNDLDSLLAVSEADAIDMVNNGKADAAIIWALKAKDKVGEGTTYSNLARTIIVGDSNYVVGFRKGSDLANMASDFMANDRRAKAVAEKYDLGDLFIAKSSSPSSVTPVTVDPLDGTIWDATEIMVNGQTIDIQQYFQLSGESGGEATITFKNGMATANLSGDANTAPYTYKDGVVTIEGESVKINGNAMVIHMQDFALKFEKRQ